MTNVYHTSEDIWLIVYTWHSFDFYSQKTIKVKAKEKTTLAKEKLPLHRYIKISSKSKSKYLSFSFNHEKYLKIFLNDDNFQQTTMQLNNQSEDFT